MVGLGYQKTRKLLDRDGFAPAVSDAAFVHLLLEPVAEGRRAEPFAYIAHERDDGGGESYTVALAGAESIHELFQNYARHCLGLRSYLERPGDGRTHPHIPAREVVWALVYAYILRLVSLFRLEWVAGLISGGQKFHNDRLRAKAAGAPEP